MTCKTCKPISSTPAPAPYLDASALDGVSTAATGRENTIVKTWTPMAGSANLGTMAITVGSKVFTMPNIKLKHGDEWLAAVNLAYKNGITSVRNPAGIQPMHEVNLPSNFHTALQNSCREAFALGAKAGGHK